MEGARCLGTNLLKNPSEDPKNRKNSPFPLLSVPHIDREHVM